MHERDWHSNERALWERRRAAQSLDSVSLTPPRRLGRLLAERRRAQGATLKELARRAEGRTTAAELALAEQGVCPLTDAEVRFLAELYGVGVDEEALRQVSQRPRLVLDYDERHGERVAAFTRRPSPEQVLARYLHIVCSMRGAAPGGSVSIRRDDVMMLAAGLGEPEEEVERLLLELMASPAALAEAGYEERPAVPGIGILVAVTARGALVLEPAGDR
ncbi:MAG: hypothetical protein ACKVWR_10015 [Acidimicrobiales bacterium]